MTLADVGISIDADSRSVHVSVLAMASLVSLALLRAYGPLGVNGPLFQPTTAPAVPTVLFGGRTSVWDRFASTPVEVSTTVAQSAATAPATTPLIPDLYLIKQALSTFSTQPAKPIAEGGPKCQDEADRLVTTMARKRKATLPSNSCCAVSVRNTNHGLIVPPKPHSDPIWRRTLDRMVRLNATSVNATTNTESNESVHAEPCDCSLGVFTGSQVLNRIVASVPPIYHYALAATEYLGQIYRPALAELRKEFTELLSLFKALAETTSTLSEFVIRRAARGVGVSRQALELASQHVKDHMPPIPHPHMHVDPEAVAKAKKKVDTLSEFVEDQAAMLADYVEEQTALLQEKSMESLRQAKRGLHKLIGETRKAIGDDSIEMRGDASSDVDRALDRIRVQDLPGSRWRAREARGRRNVKEQRNTRPRVKVVDRVRERRTRRKGPEHSGPRVEVRMEERSRAGKVWDAIHHVSLSESRRRIAHQSSQGAMALVV